MLSRKKLKKPERDTHEPILLIARRSQFARWKVAAASDGLTLKEWMVAQCERATTQPTAELAERK